MGVRYHKRCGILTRVILVQNLDRVYSSLKQPNYELLDKEVEKRKMALQEAKLKAKGLNPDGTPALSTLGGFSPASKPCKLQCKEQCCRKMSIYDESLVILYFDAVEGMRCKISHSPLRVVKLSKLLIWLKLEDNILITFGYWIFIDTHYWQPPIM